MTKLPHIEENETAVSLQHGVGMFCSAGAPVWEVIRVCMVCMDRIWEMGKIPIKSINPNAVRNNHAFGVFLAMTKLL